MLQIITTTNTVQFIDSASERPSMIYGKGEYVIEVYDTYIDIVPIESESEVNTYSMTPPITVDGTVYTTIEDLTAQLTKLFPNSPTSAGGGPSQELSLLMEEQLEKANELSEENNTLTETTNTLLEEQFQTVEGQLDNLIDIQTAILSNLSSYPGHIMFKKISIDNSGTNTVVNATLSIAPQPAATIANFTAYLLTGGSNIPITSVTGSGTDYVITLPKQSFSFGLTFNM